MTDLSEVCSDLPPWLEVAQGLITEPDTAAHTSHGKPGSRPPWNSQAANAWHDARAAIRDLEHDLRYQVTGHTRDRGGSDANTLLALAAIDALAAAMDEHTAHGAAKILTRHITVIMQLPAVDREERCRTVPAPCPRCDRAMLRVFERSGRVACLGCFAKGWMMPGTVSDGYVEWEDGEIT